VWADLGLLLVGAVCAGTGGEAFVRGAVRAAALLHVKPGLIGFTLAAFATSAPELMVAVASALAGAPAIALGNALGANALDLGLALGVSLLIGPSVLGQGNVNRDLSAALAIPVLTAIFLANGTLGRIEATVLLAIFLGWLVLVVMQERDQPGLAAPAPPVELARAGGLLVLGLVLLVAAGEAFVAGALGLGRTMGWDLFIVGATLVAFGTTLPELATSVVAKLRGEDEVGIGTILGSCIFNGGFIVPVAAFIAPPQVAFREIAVTLAAGVALVLAAMPYYRRPLGRRRGLLLLGLYAAYVALLLLLRPSAG
jgi:cation:H+ antiporter